MTRFMDFGGRDELSPELRAFLYSCIDAIEQLEMLVLLRRSGQPWTTRAVAAELGLTDVQTRASLETLTARGLLAARAGNEVTYKFEPRTPALARYADLLAEAFATSRSAVVRFVATTSRRTKSFSDAFKLRDTD
jgi:DNA-binding IclR family transcriptional regulator